MGTSIKSTAAIQKTTSPPSLCQAVTVHQDRTERDDSMEEDDNVCPLRSVKKKTLETEEAQTVCTGCGRNHPRSAYWFKDAICQRCDRKGHLVRVCRTSQPAAYHANQHSRWVPRKHKPEDSGEKSATQSPRALTKQTLCNRAHRAQRKSTSWSSLRVHHAAWK